MDKVPSFTSTVALWNYIKGQYFNIQVPTELSRKTVIDAVLESYTRLKNNSRLSSEDRLVLDSCVDLLHNTDKSIQNSCLSTNLTLAGDSINGYIKDYNSIIATCLACGITKIAGNYMTPMPEPWGIKTDNTTLTLEAQQAAGNRVADDPRWSNNFHDWSHVIGNAQGQQTPFNLNATEASKLIGQAHRLAFQDGILDLAKKLSDVPAAGGGTLLDKTLIFYANEASYNHSQQDLIAVLMGAKDLTKMEAGRFVDFADRTSIPTNWAYIPESTHRESQYGVDYGRFLVSLAHMLGLSYDEYKVPNSAGGFFKGIGDDNRMEGDPEKTLANKTTRVKRFPNFQANIGVPLPLLRKIS